MKMGGLPLVLVHGGAVDLTTQPIHKIHDGVKRAAKCGYQTLLKTHSVVSAVENAINILECDPTFNAGKGSALTLSGGIEMEASIMDGCTMKTGSVALIKNVVNPISVARKVMDKTPHAFLAGEGASAFITKNGIQTCCEEDLRTPEMVKCLQAHCTRTASGLPYQILCPDTVGCVVVDCQGHVAAGCSSGGLLGKYSGRIGDSSVPGASIYADDGIGAVSTTGHGESILRYNLAHRILNDIKCGMGPQDATIHELCCLGRKFGQNAGAITINCRGDVGIGFTTAKMAWACQQGNDLHYGYEPGQHIVEILPSSPC